MKNPITFQKIKGVTVPKLRGGRKSQVIADKRYREKYSEVKKLIQSGQEDTDSFERLMNSKGDKA
jgi:hypothetical protein